MITSILEILRRGLEAMRFNSRLLLVGVLVFVFPLLFIWVTQGFFTTAHNNIATTEKQRIGMLHDALSAVLAATPANETLLGALMNQLQSENQDIQRLAVLIEENDKFIVVVDTDQTKIGAYDEIQTQVLHTLGFSDVVNFFSLEQTVDATRIVSAYNRVITPSHTYFIVSEHNFAQLDATLLARQQKSYYGLAVIFMFLIALAYWFHRQVYWEKHHHALAKQLAERDLFSHMIAHEFRTPLTVIKGYASFLEEANELTHDEREYVQHIKVSTERLVALVNDFLEVARLQSGKLAINKKEVDVRQILQFVTKNLTATAKEKGLELIHIDTGRPVPLHTDPDRLTQMLTNIITNAIKYTEKGSVTVELTNTREGVEIRIKDTGMGISAGDQQKLFTPFARLGGVDTTSVTGTGLGMWITKQLVALLGGTIGVESIKGIGTHVVITFTDE